MIRDPPLSAPDASPPADARDRMLRAVRSVNRLLVRERDGARLVDAVCKTLTATLGYHNAWIALHPASSERLVLSAAAGLDEAQAELRVALDEGRALTCVERSRGHDALTIIEDPFRECHDCPLAKRYSGRSGFCHRLSYAGRSMGVLTVSIPRSLTQDEQARELMRELAEDLSFGLHRIGMDLRLAHLEHLVDTLPHAVAVFTEAGACEAANEPFEALLGGAGTTADLTGLADTIGDEGLAEVRGAHARAFAGQVVRQQLRLPEHDVLERWIELEHHPRADASGHVLWVVTHAEDITERKWAEIEREVMLAVLEALSEARPMQEVLPTVERLLEDTLVRGQVRIWLAPTHEAAPNDTRVALRSGGAHLGVIALPDLGARALPPRATALLERVASSVAAELAQRRAQERSRTSELRFRKAFDGGPVAMLISVLGDGRILDVNAAFVELTGLPRERALASTVHDLDLLDERFQQLAHERLEHARAASGLEVDLRRADGTVRRCIYSGDIIESEGEAQVLSVLFDVTEQRSAQDELRSSEARFRALFDHIGSGVAIYRPVDDGEDFVIVDINEAGQKLSSVDVEAVRGRRVTDVFPSVQQMGLLDVFRRVGRTGVPEEAPLTVYKDSRIEQWVENKVLRLPSGLVVALYEDTSERRRGEAEREKLNRAIQQAAEVVVILDAQGRFEYVNPAFESVWGYSREEVLGKSGAELRGRVEDEDFYLDIWAQLVRGEAWSGRLVHERRDGVRNTVDTVVSPVRDATGRITHYVAVAHDVSEQLELERRLRHASKMEAVGQLTGGVAHDFNNLLQIINGAAELALLDAREGDPVRESLEEVAEAGERAGQLVKQLLLFSRRQEMHPEPLELEAAIVDVFKLLRRVIGEHIELVWDPAPRPCPVHADRTMIEQVLLNLCVNARDAMPEGGVLTLATREAEVSAADVVGSPTASPGRFAVLEVRDTGAGMGPETLEHIFEPFFTTKGAGHGTGLGLATVYGIVKQHAGMIRVKSAPGQGTTFALYWPLTSGRAEDAPGASGSAFGVPVGSETILLAEDEPNVRAVTTRMLERSGHRVLSAADGQEALEVYDAHGAEIDLVILDAIMPRMVGRDVLRALRARGARVPVIFASGYSEGLLRPDPGEAEAFTLLPKPFDRRALLAAVRTALGRPARSTPTE